MTCRSALRLATCLTAAWLIHAASAQAGTLSGTLTADGATNFSVLDTGTGATALNITNATVTGFVGIGDPSGNNAYLSANGSTVYGGVDYAASSINGSNSVTNSRITWGVSANVAAVQTTLTALSSLSTTLGGETGTAQNITAGTGTQTVTATSGTLDGSGNYVFTVSTVNLSNGGVLTINGTGLTAGQDVVFNIGAGASFGGAINLIGLTADQVLFNVTGSGHALTLNTNGAQTQTADFLDYSGAIDVQNDIVNGRIMGGDSSTFTIGAVGQTTTITGPGVKVPEPPSLAVLGFGVAAFAFLRRRKLTFARAA